VSVIAVTDHDTTAAIDEARQRARAHGIDVIDGIEITSVDESRDVHILGYFFDHRHVSLQQFLQRQREARVARAEVIADRLAALGMPIDIAALLDAARSDTRRSLGRPQIARAMIARGHVSNVREAFDRWLATGRPAFVPREGPSPSEVIHAIHDAGGIASLAHPGKLNLAARVPVFAEVGLDALEVFHPDHDAVLVETYTTLASLSRRSSPWP
jgi:predicted metal-dependent phosphoesterase TrpH